MEQEKTTKKRTFINRTEELNGEELREMMIILPVNLHAEMKSIAQGLGLIVRDAYAEAARDWLAKHSGKKAEDAPKGNAEYRSLLEEIYTLFSKRKSHALAENTIQSIKLLVRSALKVIEG